VKQSRTEQEDAVRRFYDREVAEEERRLDVYPFEFVVTMRYVAKALRPGARVLDAACGTGRYAEALLSAGYYVGAGDLAPEHVRLTKERLEAHDLKEQLLFVRSGNALDASAYAGGPWDGILLLGPCYHLPDRRDRIDSLRQARDHLAPGGSLFVSFVSRLGAFWWGLEHWPEGILEKHGAETLLAQGTEFNFAPPDVGLPNSYFCDPRELEALFDEAGLEAKHICGTEGIFGGRVSRLQELEQPLRDAWLEFTVEHCETALFRWASEHLLVVAQSR